MRMRHGNAGRLQGSHRVLWRRPGFGGKLTNGRFRSRHAMSYGVQFSGGCVEVEPASVNSRGSSRGREPSNTDSCYHGAQVAGRWTGMVVGEAEFGQGDPISVGPRAASAVRQRRRGDRDGYCSCHLGANLGSSGSIGNPDAMRAAGNSPRPPAGEVVPTWCVRS